MRTRVDGTHTHACLFVHRGCTQRLVCSDLYLERNYDPDGVICTVNPFSDQECETCNTSRCSACGQVLAIEAHDPDCEKFSGI